MNRMMRAYQKSIIALLICMLFCGSSLLVGAHPIVVTTNQTHTTFDTVSAAGEVWVDDDYYDGGPNDGHTWGVDAFDDISYAVENITDGGIIHVREGTYSPFLIESRADITIESVDSTPVVIQGSQQIWDETASPPQFYACVIFVNGSDGIVLDGFSIKGVGLSGRSNAVFINGSSAGLYNCRVSPNEHGNMHCMAIRAQYHAEVVIDSCVIEKYGRVGVYCRTGTTIAITNNTLIGTVYTDGDGDFVNYGIEIEDLSAASDAVILYNEIFNHDHIGNPTWSSAGIIVDSWRYYKETSENSSALIKYNEIYNNMVGVQIVPNDNIQVHRNKIYDNSRYGAISDPYLVGEEYVSYDLDAGNNWWGFESGPYHEQQNPSGEGDQVSDHVVFAPWVESLLPVVNITRPLQFYLYVDFGDFIELKIPFVISLIIGKIRVETELVNSLYEIDRVEFFVDNELRSTDTTAPYVWEWDEKTMLFLYKIKVKVFDIKDNVAQDDVIVWKFL